MTQNQLDWLEQNRRVRALQRRMERQGYIFEENIYEEIMPSRVTREDIEELAEINKRELLFSPNVSYVEESTGELIPGTTYEPLPSKPKKRQKKQEIDGTIYDDDGILDNAGEVVFDRFYNEIARLEADSIRMSLLALLEKLKKQYGTNLVGKKIEESADFFNDYLGSKKYSSGDSVEEWSTMFIKKFPFENDEQKKRYEKMINENASLYFSK